MDARRAVEWLRPLACLWAVASGACAPTPSAQYLPKITIQIAGHPLVVEIARTPEERRAGLMHRRALGPDDGMLFAFPTDLPFGFFMKDTTLPLSVAFIGSNGRIVNLADMEPLTAEMHYCRTPCRYALEMPRGWFAEHGVKEGDLVLLPADLGRIE